ncbi:MAG: hypothetical protein JSV76_02110 [Candidatus Bathyarchaeota archaeon]|jgi:hypothetical protein|nr:MAG: hypothetical protein JSV76_02110 [Candidatus Bathyarchaeota archaeon]
MAQTYVQFKAFNDFIRFVTLSPTPFIQHVRLNDHDVYFVHIGFREQMLYYVELDQPIAEKYVIYNRFRDVVSFSDKLESDGQSVTVPILEVERTNVFNDYPPE